MPGPYFKGQKPESCGCYYPDIIRMRDDAGTSERVMFCITHGEVKKPLEPESFSAKVSPLPTEAWREKERQRMLTQSKERAS